MEWLMYLICLALGALILLVVQGVLIAWYIGGAPEGSPAPLVPPPGECRVSEEILHEMGVSSEGGDCAAAVSLTLQFLFQELKHAPAPLAWLHRKLHQEMVDLLTRTTSGKFFESLTVRSVATGDAAPRVRWAGVDRAETGPGGGLRTLDLLLDIDYSGGFRLAVDAGMLLGKTACLDIEVEQLSGRARVRFTRDPYTHWSLSFLSPPRLDLRARPLKGRLAALIQAHARRALQRRHTLPNYTIRYKPFFTKTDPSQLDLPAVDHSIKLQGAFEATLVEVTRLYTDGWSAEKSTKSRVYCTMSLDSNPWISYRRDEDGSTFTLDVVVAKERSQQLGAVFKQVSSEDKSNRGYVAVETVVPLSAAYRADLRRGDVLIAVDGKTVTTTGQVAKAVKGINRPRFTVRVERRVKKCFSSDESREDIKHELLGVGGEDSDPGVPKRSKSNSFSFRKMSEVLESARNVGQEGRALLRAAHSNSSIQDSEKSTSNMIEPTDHQECQSASKNHEDSTSQTPAKATSASNIISFSKHADTIQMTFGFGLRKRRCSVENRTSSDSSNSSTPTASGPGTPSKRADKVSNPAVAKQGTDDIKDSNRKQIGRSMESQSSTSLSDAQRETNERIADENVSAAVSADDLSEIKDIKICNPRISIDNCGQLYKTRADEQNDLLSTHATGGLPLCEVLSYDEKAVFALNRNHRYLNLNVWGNNGSSGEEVLLAYLNIPLMTVLNECKSSKIGKYVRKFTLLPPEVNLAVSKTHPLSAHSGFEPCLCYGDVLLSFMWSSSASPDNGRGSFQSQSRSSSIGPQDVADGDCIATECTEEMDHHDDASAKRGRGDKGDWKRHDFLRTHFHRSTQCDFCGKKIWLKDAVQCRDCAMCCHKKCVTKCLSSGRCQPATAVNQDGGASPSQELSSGFGASQHRPEFMMTEHLDGMDDGRSMSASTLTPAASQESLLRRDSNTPSGKSDEGLLGRAAFAGLLGGLRRVGSAHSLAPPNNQPPSAKSLPPSPHHTPRRQSPDEDAAWAALELVAESADVLLAEDVLRPLLAARLPPDVLLASARDLGPRLLANLPVDVRTEKLTDLIADVKLSLDAESSKLSELHRSLSAKNSSQRERAKRRRAAEECEERSQTLTALLLHCCSAMQSVGRNSISE